ncbi:MAG: class I SAM-dependent methyltransferase [Candidatus Saccharibacteria bacterium]|nr:class I SAM-dependent methyltransferase [Candidatus Saccharibacteria bacterium]
MGKESENTLIIETNKVCYNKLGKLYEDGEKDLQIITDLGCWQEFIDSLGGKRVLNVGCGQGDASADLIKKGFKLTNTDLSEEMIKIAKKKCPKAENIVLGATDLNQLGDQKFDGIMAIHLLQSLNKDMALDFFKQAHDLLNENGKLFLVFTNTCYIKSGLQPEGGAIEDNMIYWLKWKIEDVISLVNKAHFKPTSVRMQKSLVNTCGYMEPFVIICEKK